MVNKTAHVVFGVNMQIIKQMDPERVKRVLMRIGAVSVSVIIFCTWYIYSSHGC